MDILLAFKIYLIVFLLLFTAFIVAIIVDPHMVMNFIKGRKPVDIYEHEHNHENTDFTTFLVSCSMGDTDKVHSILHFHPEYLNKHSSESGDTCLHTAAILGKAALTREILKAGANPNARSKFDPGHRMTALALNVYSGHYDTVKALVEFPMTDVNMDVDSYHTPGRKVTALDMVYDVLPNGHLDEDHVKKVSSDSRMEKFYKMKELLLDYGAKTYSEVVRGGYHRDDEL